MKGFAALALGVAVAAAPVAALAQNGPITPGMQLQGTLDQGLNSAHAYVGERFMISNVTSTGGYGRVVDATIFGHVSGVTKAGWGRPGRIRLAYDALETHNGRYFSLDARPTRIQVMTKNNTAKEVGGAAAGEVVGNVAGKWIGGSLLGASTAAILGPIGLIGGFLVAHNNRAQVTIPQNSLVTLQVLHAYPQAR